MDQTTKRRGRRALGAALAVVAVMTAGGTSLSSAPSTRIDTVSTARSAPAPLEILLTNDDGFDAPGLRAVREALEAAGHDVTVVAPASDQSGSSSRLNLDFGSTFSVTQPEAGVYSVDGAPADAVMFGLTVVFADGPPDLVVSGSNFGHNAGGLVLHSGTVGAAVTAMEQGVPAIAVSTEFDFQAGQGATLAAFPATADLVVDVIDSLQRTSRSGSRLLPAGHGLNINYPILPDGAGDGATPPVAFTRVGAWSFVEPNYQPAGTDTYVVVPNLPPFDEPRRQADTTALRNDKVSISVLDGDLGASLERSARIFLRLLSLTDH